MPFVERIIVLKLGPPWGFRLQESDADGLLIHRIRKKSPADECGLKEGDVVISLNGQTTNGMSHSTAVKVIDQAMGQLEVKVGRQEAHQLTTIQLDTPVCAKFQSEESAPHIDHHKDTPMSPAPWEPVPQQAPPEQPVFQQPLNETKAIEIPVSQLPELPEIKPFEPTMNKPQPIPLSKLFKECETPSPNIDSKKKQFGDSAFFSTGGQKYPTKEEQMSLAHNVAASLTEPANQNSKGANMFQKRKRRMEKFTIKNYDEEAEAELLAERQAAAMAAVSAYSSSDDDDENGVSYRPIPAPPPVPPPKTDFENARAAPRVNHGQVNPAVCFDIASALHSNSSRGAQIFNKRKVRSKKWEVEAPEPTPEPVLLPVQAVALGPAKPKVPSQLGQYSNDGVNEPRVASWTGPATMEATKAPVVEGPSDSKEWKPVRFKIPQKTT